MSPNNLSAAPLLSTINDPAAMRRLQRPQLQALADELRQFLLHSVAGTGGHLSSNLGTVELTVALHYVFNTPNDRIVWDVGHQTYPHKILTGRRDRMQSLRQFGGLSGFPRREESEYDTFGTAHSSTSISAALGMALASRIKGEDRYSVAVIGDGAMTAGMAFEAMNNAGVEDCRLLVILNDNDMSISPPVGALNRYLAQLLSGSFYTAAKNVGKSVLKLGTLQPTLPVASINDVRLLPSTYNGSLLTSQDIDGLTLNVGRLEKQNLRDSSSNDQMSYAGVQSSHLDLAGGTYALRPNLALSYYYAQMHDLYRQQYAGLVHDLPLAEGVSLRSDLRYFDTREQGNANLRSAARVDGGRIDNRFFNGMLTLGVGAHKFGLGYQNLSGDGDFAYPGLDPYSVNLVTVNVFTKAETDAWQARYDYNFAALGLPGLSFMTRYVNGNHIQTATVSGGKEWERDTDIAYVVQSGPLKNVSVRLRNATFRSSGGLTSDIDENRLIVGYTLALW